MTKLGWGNSHPKQNKKALHESAELILFSFSSSASTSRRRVILDAWPVISKVLEDHIWQEPYYIHYIYCAFELIANNLQPSIDS